jgi:hypothetical protein
MKVRALKPMAYASKRRKKGEIFTMKNRDAKLFLAMKVVAEHVPEPEPKPEPKRAPRRRPRATAEGAGNYSRRDMTAED